MQLGRPPGLRGFVEHTLEVARAAAPAPGAAAPDPVFAEVSEVGGGSWQLRVGLSEGASQTLPPQVYADFEDLLRGLPGVVEAVGEDREEFLVRTDGRLRPRRSKTRSTRRCRRSSEASAHPAAADGPVHDHRLGWPEAV